METQNMGNKTLDEIAFEPCLEYHAKVEQWLLSFMRSKYGTNDLEECRKIIAEKRLSIAYDSEGMIGVIANNRWLYTIDGRVIGKKGNRFLIDPLS